MPRPAPGPRGLLLTGVVLANKKNRAPLPRQPFGLWRRGLSDIATTPLNLPPVRKSCLKNALGAGGTTSPI